MKFNIPFSILVSTLVVVSFTTTGCGKGNPKDTQISLIYGMTNPFKNFFGFTKNIDFLDINGNQIVFSNDGSRKRIDDLKLKVPASPTNASGIVSVINNTPASILYYQGHGFTSDAAETVYTGDLSIDPQEEDFGANFGGLSAGGKVRASDLHPKSSYYFIFLNSCYSGRTGFEVWVAALTVKGPDDTPPSIPTYMGWPNRAPQTGGIIFAEKFFEFCKGHTAVSQALESAWEYTSQTPGSPINVGITNNTIPPAIMSGLNSLTLDHNP